ncbi:MAG: rhomboid family intramembrane serine protease [Desertimonas sp.]
MINARQPTLVTYSLIAINLAIFALITINNPDTLRSTGIFRSPGELGQDDLGLARAFLVDGQWYRMVTSGFLHFGVIHLAFNMLLLFQLGQLLEPAVGRVRFLLLYFASMLAGSAGAMLLQPDAFHGGASGAVFGLMGAAAVAMHRRGVNIFSTGLGTTLLLNLILTFSISGISIGGHLGGVIGGTAAGWFMLTPNWRSTPEWASYVAPVAVGAISVLATWLVVQAA